MLHEQHGFDDAAGGGFGLSVVNFGEREGLDQALDGELAIPPELGQLRNERLRIGVALDDADDALPHSESISGDHEVGLGHADQCERPPGRKRAYGCSANGIDAGRVDSVVHAAPGRRDYLRGDVVSAAVDDVRRPD